MADILERMGLFLIQDWIVYKRCFLEKAFKARIQEVLIAD
jgi:hypothetical protein